MKSSRGTGRTQRMLERAVKALQNEEVTVVAANATQARELMRRLTEMLPGAKVYNARLLISAFGRCLWVVPMDAMDAHQRGKLPMKTFTDHHAREG